MVEIPSVDRLGGVSRISTTVLSKPFRNTSQTNSTQISFLKLVSVPFPFEIAISLAVFPALSFKVKLGLNDIKI